MFQTRIVPHDWCIGILTQLNEKNGKQYNSLNRRPLLILAHVQKLLENVVKLENVDQFQSGEAKFRFQLGVNIMPA